jgi:hypothetical protein
MGYYLKILRLKIIMFQAQAFGGLGEQKLTDTEGSILLPVRKPLLIPFNN